MKLTAVAGGSPQFEIFVIGNQGIHANALEKEFSDRFVKRQHDAREDYNYEAQASFAGTASNLEIGHPGITSLMWDDCVLTKFAGTVDSKNMTSDMLFTWSPFEAYQQHFFTVSGATELALILFVLLTGGWCFVSMIVCEKRIKQANGFRWYAGRVLLPAIVLLALGDRELCL